MKPLFYLTILLLFTILYSKKAFHRKDFPKSLGQLKQQLFPENLMEQNKSEIEESPSEFSLMSPLTPQQNKLLEANNVYSKDPKEFGQTPANLSDIRPGQVYLVKNLTALALTPGFEDPNDQYLPHERRHPIYHKDQMAYYNPVGSIKNMYKKTREGLYSVPIEVYANGTKAFEESRARNVFLTDIKKRLKRDKSAYYDPFYIPEVKIMDSQNLTLMKAAKDKIRPKAQQYDDFLKDREREKNDIEILLGKKEELPRIVGRDEGLDQALRKAKVHREAKEVAEEVKADFHPSKSKEPYYDSSVLLKSRKHKSAPSKSRRNGHRAHF